MASIATDRLSKVFGDVVAVDEVSIEVASGEFVALLGPTGCGKSTVLRMVAGLESPTEGQVLIDGRVITQLPARERRVAMVFQDYALYPHLTVEQNIGFPLRSGAEPVAGGSARVAEVAEELGITRLLRRRPGSLSGGERQRVAVARAIVRNPRAFLLDEPLSNVDASLRAELRTEVAALARRLAVTTLYVTHDQAEALAMADRVAVLRRGRLEQIGSPARVYGDPDTVFVAAFLGTPRTNLLQGAVYANADGAVIDLGTQVIGFPPDDPRTTALAVRHTQRITLALRADALTPVPAGTATGPLLRGTVRQVENLGHEALAYVDTGAVPTSVAESRLEHPDTGRSLADLLAEDQPTGRSARPSSGQPARTAFRRPFGWSSPQSRPADGPPATARTRYGFYPVYDPSEDDRPIQGDLVVRIPAPVVPRTGEPMTVAVDLDRLLLFDRAGDRIRLP